MCSPHALCSVACYDHQALPFSRFKLIYDSHHALVDFAAIGLSKAHNQDTVM